MDKWSTGGDEEEVGGEWVNMMCGMKGGRKRRGDRRCGADLQSHTEMNPSHPVWWGWNWSFSK